MQVSHGASGTPPKSSALRAAAASFAEYLENEA